ncbi:MAG: glycosyltransferase family 4 protein [Gammaproteobacteria bacterium]
MRIALVTDAWSPLVNGVVTTLRHTVDALETLGVEVRTLTPEGHRTVRCPSYPEIRLAYGVTARVREELAAFVPDAVHIATEGALGLAARRACLDWRWRFTTSYHTRFPEYLRARWPIPEAWSYAWLRWFHGAAARTMVGTPTLRDELGARGFRHLVDWSRGVDTELFRPRAPVVELPWGVRRDARPILVHVGRVAVEKNIEAFLALELPVTKVVVGDGPAREALQRRFPQVHWTGYLHGEALASVVAQADCLVFPSLTDTFGLVMLEAMACGVPVAAFPVTGPVDVVTPGVTGELAPDLAVAVTRALRLDRAGVRAAVVARGWQGSSAQFLANLVPARTASIPRMRGALPQWVGERP